MRVAFFLFYIAALWLVGWLVSVGLAHVDSLEPLSWSSIWHEVVMQWQRVVHYTHAADIWNVLTLVGLCSLLLIWFAILNIIFYSALRHHDFPDWLRWIFIKTVSIVLTCFSFVAATHYMVALYSGPKIYTVIDELPQRTVVLLGTRRVLESGKINAYYRYRIDAAFDLFLQGKVKHFIVSGDHTGTYNEPLDMKNDLVRMGVPESMITMDGGGFRTLDSIVRIKNTFGLNQILVVSQGFHLERAIFLAWYYSVDALGYDAGGKMNEAMVKREFLAKPNLFLDVFIFNTQPTEGKTLTRRRWTGSGADLTIAGLDLALAALALSLAYYSLRF